MSGWIADLGPMAWPLFAASVLGLGVALERAAFFLRTARRAADARRLDRALVLGHHDAIQRTLVASRHPWDQGLRLLYHHAQAPAGLREEMLNVWLLAQRAGLTANIRWLTLVAVVSPLLGLLGTVLGMVEAFEALVRHGGPVQPAVLADGLRQAMLTTVVGLLIAVPALVLAHLFRFWAEARLGRLQCSLNRVHLLLQGADLGAASQMGGRPAGADAADARGQPA
jgi:biopolymer transport protein ExbB